MISTVPDRQESTATQAADELFPVEIPDETRVIGWSRLKSALTDDIPLERTADGFYEATGSQGETYEIDARTAACTCHDHQYRGDKTVCKHALKAATHDLLIKGRPQSKIQALLIEAVREIGCPSGVWFCDSILGRGLPCNDCIRRIDIDIYTVYQRLVPDPESGVYAHERVDNWYSRTD